VAVSCPGCGREYEATRFELGRTIRCRCGSRVGLEAPVRSRADAATPRFAADAMLGGLARWLRLLGIDCIWEDAIDDARLVRRALEERRVLLTRDRRLPEEWRIEDVYLVDRKGARAQLEEVVRRFGLAAALRPLTRCSACNRPLRRAPPEEIAGRAPAHILEHHAELSECPGCGRVYWEGSHADRIRAVAARIRESAAACG